MILDEIAEKTKIRVEKAKKKVSAEQMKKIADDYRRRFVDRTFKSLEIVDNL